MRVVAWDDPRCVQPLEAAAALWHYVGGGEIAIARRPLTAFNDQPLSELSGSCDVMIIDYPHVAQAQAENAITPICALLPEGAIAAHAADALGPAHESFLVGGRCLALASDAACQVAAYRPQLLDRLGVAVPGSWGQVFALAEAHPGAVAVPLYHTDAISCLLSLLAGAGSPPDGGAGMFPNRDAAEEALALLAKLADAVDPVCWSCTPQAIHREANAGERIAYVPLTFGYTRLTRPKEGGWRFAAPPAGCGSLLGGAGMAVSSQASDPHRAARFASWYCSPEIQIHAGKRGGQPASASAWCDPEVDALAGGFFSDTIATQSRAYVRPRAVWWPAVQTACGERLVAGLRKDENHTAIIDALEAIYARLRTERSPS